MENELLKSSSIPELKAIMDHASREIAFSHQTEDYWIDVYQKCENELKLRIDKIFPE